MVKEKIKSKRLIISVIVGTIAFGVSSLLFGLFSFGTNIHVSVIQPILTALFFGIITYYVLDQTPIKNKKTIPLFIFIIGSLIVFIYSGWLINDFVTSMVIPNIPTEFFLSSNVMIYGIIEFVSFVVRLLVIFIFYLLMKKISQFKPLFLF